MLRLRFQIQRLVVQAVDQLSVSLRDAMRWGLLQRWGGSLRENVVLCIDENVERREDVLLIDDSLHGLPTAHAQLATVYMG